MTSNTMNGVQAFAHSPDPFDPGGSIIHYLMDNANPQRIAGTCISACTLKLGAKDVCVVAGTATKIRTVLWCHAPGGDDASNSGKKLMLQAYARFPLVKQWIAQNDVLDSEAFSAQNTLTGSQLVKMGVPTCIQ